MKKNERFLDRQREKVTSYERLEKKRIKAQERDVRKANKIFGPEEHRENQKEEQKWSSEKV